MEAKQKVQLPSLQMESILLSGRNIAGCVTALFGLPCLAWCLWTISGNFSIMLLNPGEATEIRLCPRGNNQSTGLPVRMPIQRWKDAKFSVKNLPITSTLFIAHSTANWKYPGVWFNLEWYCRPEAHFEVCLSRILIIRWRWPMRLRLIWDRGPAWPWRCALCSRWIRSLKNDVRKPSPLLSRGLARIHMWSIPVTVLKAGSEQKNPVLIKVRNALFRFNTWLG